MAPVPDHDFLSTPFFTSKIRMTRIIALAIGVCPFVYVAIGFFASKGRAMAVNPASNVILLGLYVFSAVTGVMGILIPDRLLARSALEAPDEAGAGPSRQKLGRLLDAFTRTTILRLALFESIGIYGLLGGIMAGDTVILVALNIFSALLIILHFPGRERFLGFVDKVER
jgi:hypothetical protein